ncbi:MAG: prephenate dehydrogenase/arogenate dehydrogenase family protein, partial [Patescibacteria group bacterium]|nr:prephenate dehydrogenase/arogenate dehydrogenase family protein [Patescibacteria group bacterium]
MKTVTIIGFGRFGQTLYRLIKDDFKITIYNRSDIPWEVQQNFTQQTKIVKTLKQAYESNTIFFTVPINSIETLLQEHKMFIASSHVLIDVLSVKIHPKHMFEKYTPDSQILLTHPMFGPDSSKNGFEGLPIILDKFKTKEETYTFWKDYFIGKKLRVLEMSADEHDRLAAKSQGMTHFIGRLLEKAEFQSTPIDSLGTKKLLEVKDQTCNDTWELFTDLQVYNPYTKEMRITVGKAYDTLYNNLLPKQIHENYITYGIQGGVGSFNEEALQTYISKHKIAHHKTEYLYTSEKVLKNLHEGIIDFGIFAISNSTGGLVEESIQAMAKYR